LVANPTATASSTGRMAPGIFAAEAGQRLRLLAGVEAKLS